MIQAYGSIANMPGASSLAPNVIKELDQMLSAKAAGVKAGVQMVTIQKAPAPAAKKPKITPLPIDVD